MRTAIVYAVSLFLTLPLINACGGGTQPGRQPATSLPGGNRLMSSPRLGGAVGYRPFDNSSVEN